jgi:hypothetical protein
MKKRILPLLLMLLAAIGCEERREGPMPMILHKSYIERFLECENISLNVRYGFSLDETNKTILDMNTHAVEDFEYSLSDGIEIGVNMSGYEIDQQNKKELYDELTESIGDTNWGMELPISGRTFTAMKETITDFKITTETDYDATHPAGSDVSSYFTVYYDDMYATVKNGYKSMPGYYHHSWIGDLPQSCYKSVLSTMDFSVKPYIADEIGCVLTQKPATAGSYSFTFTIALDNGKILVGTTKPLKLTAH